MSVSGTERQVDGAAVERPSFSEPATGGPGPMGGWEYSAQSIQLPGSTDGVQPTRPLGFWLVLAALFVVAIIYSVTMLTIGSQIRSPATAIGAMTTAFAVIGTLVGTYFGIKAGLDGQDKVKDAANRTIRAGESRPRNPNQWENE
jgi:hypothetical protein